MSKTPNERARDWLVEHDPAPHREGSTASTFWGGQPDASDFVGALLDNLTTFGVGLDDYAYASATGRSVDDIKITIEEALAIVSDAWRERNWRDGERGC